MKETKWDCLERMIDLANYVSGTRPLAGLPWIGVGTVQQAIEAHYGLIGEAEDFWAEKADFDYCEFIHGQIDLIWGVSIEGEE